jgi:hypothetical protein
MQKEIRNEEMKEKQVEKRIREGNWGATKGRNDEEKKIRVQLCFYVTVLVASRNREWSDSEM